MARKNRTPEERREREPYLQHLLTVMMEHLYDADTAYLEDLEYSARD